MKTKAISGPVLKAESDCLLLGLSEGETPSGGVVGEVDRALKGAISDLTKEGELRGELNQVTVLHTLGRIPAKRVMVTGLGESSQFSLDRVRQVAGTSLKKVKEIGAKTVSAPLPQIHLKGVRAADLSQALVEGAILGLYQFTKYKEGRTDADLEELTIAAPDKGRVKDIKNGIERGEILATSQNFARDLVNEPGNALTPSALAERAEETCKEFGLGLQVLERADMKTLGMGGLLAVARGSQEPPKLIVMRYEKGRGVPLVALVGKGITFDSGGISLKSSDKMETMKADMAGGAAVMGAMRAISQLKPEVNVVGMIPAAENMPSGHALKPGDIIECLNGKTVEIISTDAEGRLILADALAYGVKLGAAKIIDIATLTGGCVVALGELTSGVLGNDQKLIDLFIKVSKKTGEKFWQLPLLEEYKEQLKSEVADIKNSGGRAASTITASIFLKEFVGDTPWVHIDIAGKELSHKESDKYKGYSVRGATGVGTRTLAELVCELAKSGKTG